MHPIIFELCIGVWLVVNKKSKEVKYVIKKLLTDPGEARGCSINSLVIN